MQGSSGKASSVALHLILAVSAAASAQGPVQPTAVAAFHPAGPLPSYEVATIRLADPGQPYGGTTIRRYIADAYGVPIPWGMPGVEYSGSRVLGGPAWIDKDRYEIKGKIPDELRAARKNMSSQERDAQTEMMQQSLLADRFHLKVHFETREMPIFELVPAKGGLKIKPSDPPPVSADGTRAKLAGPLPRGSANMGIDGSGGTILNAHAITIELLCDAIRGQSPDIAGRPIVDMSGFKGNFDVKDFRFAGLAPPQHAAGDSTPSDAPSVYDALQQQLGLRLVATKAPVEVVVIDSIDRPSEN